MPAEGQGQGRRINRNLSEALGAFPKCKAGPPRTGGRAKFEHKSKYSSFTAKASLNGTVLKSIFIIFSKKCAYSIVFIIHL